jgi:site-specific recombinase XerD
MKRATCTVLYYINRGKKLKTGEAPIYSRITVNKHRAEFAIGRYIDPDCWNQDDCKATGGSKEAKEINSYLGLIRANLLVKKRELEEDGRTVTAIDLKYTYLGIEAEEKTILQIFKEHNDRAEALVNKDFAIGTVERYQTCYKHIKAFIQKRYKRSDCRISEVTHMFMTEFEYYMKTTRKCCNNTTVKYIKNFKKIVRIALANGWLKKDPFVGIKYRLDDVDLAFLTEEELKIMMTKHIGIERLEVVRDTYLFCCFTGLAFVDVQSLKYSDLENRNGKLWMKKRRQKTKNLCTVPLVEAAVQLIGKYRENVYCIANNVVLPVISNQKMNAYLKEIATICGIKKHLSTHTARHTFATTVTLSNQISIEVVSKMLGHSSINMTKKYARVVDELINKDMQKLENKYNLILKSEN